MAERAAIILAAGQGTRMRSPLPKVLHKVGARTLLYRAIDVAEALGCARIVVVAGTHSPAVAEHARKRLGDNGVAIQDPPLGTGHAVRAAESLLADFDGDVVITTADAPLLDAETIAPLFEARSEADLTLLGFDAADPTPYGRLIFGAGGVLQRIVEAKDANPDELKVKVCNSGVLAAPAPLLFKLLRELKNDNAKGEYYLTDVVGIARDRRFEVRAVLAPEQKVLGVNSQVELAGAEGLFQAARRRALLEGGVAMPAPDTVMLSWDTEIAPGVTVEPYVVFGPGVTVEAGAQVRAFSHLEGAVVREGAIVGPYARLRPGADIGRGAHVGNFCEVKNVKMGEGAKVNHLSYVGDGSIGARTNIGAGTIFCNYDGFSKFETHVGEDAFIGSDSALVAPVKVGDRAYVATGSVITEDVAEDALAIARQRQVEKPGWAMRFRASKGKKP